MCLICQWPCASKVAGCCLAEKATRAVKAHSCCIDFRACCFGPCSPSLPVRNLILDEDCSDFIKSLDTRLMGFGDHSQLTFKEVLTSKPRYFWSIWSLTPPPKFFCEFFVYAIHRLNNFRDIRHVYPQDTLPGYEDHDSRLDTTATLVMLELCV